MHIRFAHGYWIGSVKRISTRDHEHEVRVCVGAKRRHMISNLLQDSWKESSRAGLLLFLGLFVCWRNQLFDWRILTVGFFRWWQRKNKCITMELVATLVEKPARILLTMLANLSL